MRMLNVLIIFCTCPNAEEAERLAEGLVEGRYAACVNILSGVRSCYRWQEKIERSEEILLLIKTTAEHFDAVGDYISSKHSYETPEIVAVPVVAGFEPYLRWIADEVSQRKP